MNIRLRKKNSSLIYKKPPIEYLSIPNTCIIAAVIENNLAEVVKLRDNTEENELIDALWVAAAYGKLSILEFLVTSGVNLNIPSSICVQHSYHIQISV
jgi:hypothetical protein